MSPRDWKFRLEDIKESLELISEYIQEQYADIPWCKMKGMRNILIHEYFGVDIDVLWRTVQEDLPLLKIKLQKVI